MNIERPYLSHHFRVSFLGIGGLSERNTHFQSVSGLSVSFEPEPHKEGGEPRFSHKLTDTPSYGPLVLKRGLIDDLELWAWCTATFTTMHTVPVNMVISLLGSDHMPVKNWFVVGAIPKGWSTSNFNAESTNIMIETITLNYQYFIRI